jgi:hypothetical protein
MDKEVFKKIVIEEAKKVIFEGQDNSITEKTSDNTGIKGITPNQVKALAEEMKKINKKIDLKNPLISESVIKVVDETSKEAEEINESENSLRERELDVDTINKKKHINFQNEGEKDTWKRILGYDVPSDEEREN